MICCTTCYINLAWPHNITCDTLSRFSQIFRSLSTDALNSFAVLCFVPGEVKGLVLKRAWIGTFNDYFLSANYTDNRGKDICYYGVADKCNVMIITFYVTYYHHWSPAESLIRLLLFKLLIILRSKDIFNHIVMDCETEIVDTLSSFRQTMAIPKWQMSLKLLLICTKQWKNYNYSLVVPYSSSYSKDIFWQAIIFSCGLHNSIVMSRTDISWSVKHVTSGWTCV